MINMFRMRKTIARILLPFLMIWMCVVPSRSYAFVPLVPIGLSVIAASGLTFTAVDIAGMAIATAGVGALLYMEFTNPDNSSVAVPLQDQAVNPSAIVPLPVGMATPPVPLPSGVLPSTVASTLGYCADNWCGGSYLTPDGPPQVFGAPDQICSSYIATLDNTGWQSSRAVDYSNTFVCERQGIVYLNWVAVRVYYKSVGCIPGYTASGSTCVLNNSRLAQDNRQDWIRQGNAYSRYTGDLSGSAAGTLGTTNTANDTVSMIGKDSAGNVISYSIVALPGGGSKIVKKTQLVDASGNSYVQTRTIGFDSSGTQVTSSGSSESGSLNPAIPAADGGATVEPAPAGTIPGNPTSTAPLVFPSDYSRAGEAGAAAIPIGAKLDTLHGDLSNTTTVNDPAVPVETEMPGWGTTFNNLLSWNLPAHNSVCPEPAMDLTNLGLGNHQLTSHCALLNNHAAAIHSSMIVVFTIMALFIVLRA